MDEEEYENLIDGYYDSVEVAKLMGLINAAVQNEARIVKREGRASSEWLGFVGSIDESTALAVRMASKGR